jgi:metallo-beta-lactamase class B
MNPLRIVRLPALACLIAAATTVSPRAQQDQAAAWSVPVEPFRIAGNVHYVGTTELGIYLITTADGHILIDGGFAETTPVILASIRKLGFDPRDLKVLLTTQAHMDHVGSMASLKKATGARVMVMEGDVPMMESGGKGDFAFGDSFMFAPVTVDRVLRDGDVVTVGATTLTAHLTPGHTRGCTTWTMTVDEGGEARKVIFPGSLSVNPQVRLVQDPSYPGIADDYARSFARMRAFDAEIFLGAHAGFFAFQEKAARLRQGATPNPFIDRPGLLAWIDRMEGQFRERVEKEHGDRQSRDTAPSRSP